jgi:hypothetical protein
MSSEHPQYGCDSDGKIWSLTASRYRTRLRLRCGTDSPLLQATHFQSGNIMKPRTVGKGDEKETRVYVSIEGSGPKGIEIGGTCARSIAPRISNANPPLLPPDFFCVQPSRRSAATWPSEAKGAARRWVVGGGWRAGDWQRAACGGRADVRAAAAAKGGSDSG